MELLKSKKLKIIKDYDQVNWEEVIPVLIAYAYSLLGEKQFSNSRKKLAYDFAMDTILRYLENKDKFDPNRNPDLIKYLKYNILRQLVSNFKGSSAVKTRVQITKDNQTGKDNFSLEELHKMNSSHIERNIDTDLLVYNIDKRLRNKRDLQEIFNLTYKNDSKRSEVCKDLNIEEAEFNNRLRRLKRIIEKEVKSFRKAMKNGK